MNKEKLEYYSYLTVTALGALLFGYIFIKYIFMLALPFLIAWGVAFSVRPMAEKISGATKISYKVISVILTVLLVLGSIAVIISACVFALGEAWDFLSGLAENNTVYDVLDRIMDSIGGFLGHREGGEELEAHISDAIFSTVSSLLSSVVSVLTSFVGSVPRVLIFVLVTVIASVYFSLDLENINSFVKSHLPKTVSSWLSGFKKRFLSSLLKYLRAYLIIMLITFVVMLFGFMLLGVKYSVLLAFIVALLDALPLIGVGTVILPWSIYQLIFGNFRLGVGLIILFIVHEVIRQFIEPKIVGKNLGIHPVISLILLYIGYSLFGMLGLFLIPFVSVVLNILLNKNNSSEIT